MERGYILLYRALMDSKGYLGNKFDKTRAWIDLLFLTNHKDAITYRSSREIEVKRGQCGYSFFELSKRWKWDRKTVTAFLNSLVKEKQIEIINLGSSVIKLIS